MQTPAASPTTSLWPQPVPVVVSLPPSHHVVFSLPAKLTEESRNGAGGGGGFVGVVGAAVRALLGGEPFEIAKMPSTLETHQHTCIFL